MGTELFMTAGQTVVKLFNGQLVEFDYFVMGCICALTGAFIKYILKAKEGEYIPVKVLMPIILGLIIYVVGGLIQKTPIWDSIKIGLIVGLGSMGFYDVISRVFVVKGKASVNEIGNAVHEEIKKNV